MMTLKPMVSTNYSIVSIALLLSFVTLSGCTATTETGAPNTANTNTAVANRAGNAAVVANTSEPNNNNLAVTNTNGDRRPTSAAKQPTPYIGSGGDDLSLFTQVRGALSSDKELTNAVIVDIKEGVVTMNGNVSSQAQKAKAETLVKGIAGVKSVKNNLRAS